MFKMPIHANFIIHATERYLVNFSDVSHNPTDLQASQKSCTATKSGLYPRGVNFPTSLQFSY